MSTETLAGFCLGLLVATAIAVAEILRSRRPPLSTAWVDVHGVEHTVTTPRSAKHAKRIHDKLVQQMQRRHKPTGAL